MQKRSGAVAPSILALVIAAMLGGCMSAAAERARAQQAAERAAHAEQAAARAEAEAVKAQKAAEAATLAADRATKAVEDATREINAVAARIDELYKQSAGTHSKAKMPLRRTARTSAASLDPPPLSASKESP